MPHPSPQTSHISESQQAEQAARDLLDHSIEQLAATRVGDAEWLEACQLLGQLDSQFVPLQIEALADDRYQVCRALSVSLSRIGPSVFYDVIAALGHEHPNVRQFAAGLLYGLAQRGGVVIEDAVPALAGALQDADCQVRQKAAVTLSFIGPAAEAAVFQLTEALSDRDDFVREWAAHALTSIGSAAESAVPALVDRLDDQEPAVRQAASDALVAI